MLVCSTIFNSCPKLITYLVSKIWVLMSLKISSKVFSNTVVCVVNWTNHLPITNWFIGSHKPTQFEWNGSINSTISCDIESLPYSSLIVWIIESCIYSLVCQLTIVFAFNSSHSLSTCCLGTWLCVMIVATTLTSTLSSL